MLLDNSELNWFAAPRAGIIHKKVKRHGKGPLALGELKSRRPRHPREGCVATEQSWTLTLSHSSTLLAPKCRQDPLGPASHFRLWLGRTSVRPPGHNAEIDRPRS